MSEMRSLLVATAGRVMADAGEEFSPAMWRALEAAELPHAPLADGVDGGDSLAILREAGRRALAAPLMETMLAARLLAESGLAVPAGPLTVAPVEREELTLARGASGWRLEGRARFVPWARHSVAVAVLAGGQVACVPAQKLTLVPGRNVADEPRDELVFATELADEAVAPAATDWETLWRRGALARAAMLAGAMETVLDLTLRYAGERTQFGRPIGRFQAIQQQIAVLAGQAAAAGVACDAAADGEDTFAIAVAKARAGEAAGPVAAIAHQVLGAMGFAREHRLNLYTRRLWAWREEFGDEAYWWRFLGRAAAAAGGDGLWPLVTDRPVDQR